MLVSLCACRWSRVLIDDIIGETVVECHCRSCQSYHAAASVHYVLAKEIRIVTGDEDDSVGQEVLLAVSELPNGKSFKSNKMRLYLDRCDYVSRPVRRGFCPKCFSRLYSVLQDIEDDKIDPTTVREQQFMVNLGSMVDKTIPDALFRPLSLGDFVRWKPEMLPYWAKPDQDTDTTLSPHHQDTIRGKCHCSTCQYEFMAAKQTEVQHCYCLLCRRHSGSLFTSWIPVQTLPQRFRWIESALAIRRPTESSRRFFCSTCGTCLAILYDWEETNDPETSWIWISGGSMNSTNQPLQLERRAHIYCQYKPQWYTIPDDGLSQCSDSSE